MKKINSGKFSWIVRSAAKHYLRYGMWQNTRKNQYVG